MHSPILQPVVVLAGWTLIILIWLVARRLPAMKAMGIDLSKTVGGRGGDLEGKVAPKVTWPAHNYAHLVEQPTLFYAVALVLALTGADYTLNVWLAWAYALLRIAHSLWQVTVNVVLVRFLLFAASTLCLVALTVHAAMAVF